MVLEAKCMGLNMITTGWFLVGSTYVLNLDNDKGCIMLTVPNPYNGFAYYGQLEDFLKEWEF